MATQVLTNAKLLVNGFDFSGDMNALSLEYGAELQDNTTFGADTRSRKGGLKTVTLGGEGFWNADGTDEPDDVLFGRVGQDTSVMTVAPNDGAAGSIAYIVNGIVGQYSHGGAIGDMHGFSVAAEAQSRLVQGTVLHNASQTTTGNGTAYQVGAVGASQSLHAAIHVLSVSGTSPTLNVIVQSDDGAGFLSPTNRITFTQATAIGAQWATPVAGAITDTYWRVNYTIGGTGTPTFLFVVTIGIL